MSKIIKLWNHPIEMPNGNLADEECYRIQGQYDLDAAIVLVHKNEKAQIAVAFNTDEIDIHDLQHLLCFGIRQLWKLKLFQGKEIGE